MFNMEKNNCKIKKITFDKSANIPYQLLELTLENDSILISSEFIEILFIYDQVDILINEKRLMAFAGDLLIIKGKHPIEIMSRKETAKIVLMQCHHALFTQEVMLALVKWPILHDLVRLQAEKSEYLYFYNIEKNIECYAQLLINEAKKGQKGSWQNVIYALLMFLSHLHEVHYEYLSISESTMMQNYIIGDILKYMSENCHQISLEQVAKAFNFHPNYFSAYFKHLAGETYSNKLLQLRLEKASRLLITSAWTIQEICDHIGLKDKSYFHKCFKMAYDMTPAVYRKKHCEK